MSFFGITLEAIGPVSVIWLQQGEENRFVPDFLDSLTTAFEQLEASDTTKAIVIGTRSAKFFSTGIDLDWLTAQGPEVMPGFLKQVARLLYRTVSCGKPTIGCLGGHAVGLGAIWSCAFDFRIMRKDRGWFRFPEVDVGIPLADGMMELIGNSIPFPAYNRLLLTGDKIGGPEAVALGVAEACYDSEEIMPKTLQMAEKLAAKETSIYASLKRSIRGEVIAAYERYLAQA